MPHFLDPLLMPDSIAVVGASRRAGTVGNTVLQNLLRGGFGGRLFAVNPGYPDVAGVPCYPTLEALPARAAQVIFAVSDERIEAALEDAIRHGARSCVIYSSLVLAQDGTPALKERVLARIHAAGLVACGANGMGYYNFRDRVWACGFATRAHRSDGSITLISQSGAGMSGIVDVDERLDFNLAVSTGQELSVAVEDYMDWALEQPQTRVIGLFLETSRHPPRLRQVLDKARARGIPVVALKVGRTALAAELAVSHCGALAGSDAVYDAVFDAHGVQRVADMDELATALLMFAQPRAVGAGGVVSIHDSGGERQLLIDLADRGNVPLTQLQPDSAARLGALLDPGLPAVNPLDAWSAGGADYHRTMAECFAALMCDPGAAIGAVVHDRAAGGTLFPGYADYLRAGQAASGKPAFLVSNRQGTGADALVTELTREGFPVIDGVASFLAGARCLFGHRDAQARAQVVTPAADAAVIERWRRRLAAPGVIGEAELLGLLAAAGVPAVAATQVDDERALRALAPDLEYPVVLKSAQPGLAHKSDAGGVLLNIAGPEALLAAYAALCRRFGPAATVAPMVTAPGVEMILGMSTDAQFGPVVLVGIGGIHAELLHDAVTLLPPFDAASVERRLDKLKLRRLLDGVRGCPELDVAAFCRAAAAFSVLVPQVAELAREIDINPIKVLQRGCIALDALLVRPAATPAAQRRSA